MPRSSPSDIDPYVWLRKGQRRRLYAGFNFPAATPVSSTFTGADSTTSLGTADTGQAWTNRVGVFGITSNKGYSVGAVANGNIATVSTGAGPARTVQADMATDATNTHLFGLVPLLVDANNFVVVSDFAATATIAVKIGGAFGATVNLGSMPGVSGSGAAAFTYKTTISPTGFIQAYVNGAVMSGGYQLSRAEIAVLGAAGTNAGVFLSGTAGTDTTCTFDNFSAS